MTNQNVQRSINVWNVLTISNLFLVSNYWHKIKFYSVAFKAIFISFFWVARTYKFLVMAVAFNWVAIFKFSQQLLLLTTHFSTLYRLIVEVSFFFILFASRRNLTPDTLNIWSLFSWFNYHPTQKTLTSK